MIEEVLKEIRDAEEQAEQLQKEAYQQGKELVLATELKAEKIKKEAVNGCKADYRKAVAEAEKRAFKAREIILNEGAKRAEQLVSDKQAEINASADKIVAAFLGKY